MTLRAGGRLTAEETRPHRLAELFGHEQPYLTRRTPALLPRHPRKTSNKRTQTRARAGACQAFLGLLTLTEWSEFRWNERFFDGLTS